MKFFKVTGHLGRDHDASERVGQDGRDVEGGTEPLDESGEGGAAPGEDDPTQAGDVVVLDRK